MIFEVYGPDPEQIGPGSIFLALKAQGQGQGLGLRVVDSAMKNSVWHYQDRARVRACPENSG